MSTTLRPQRDPQALRRQRASARRAEPAPPRSERDVLLACALHGLLALVGAVAIAMIGMLLCWIIASGGSGSAADAVRSGVLVVLAACHGGLRISGTDVQFVPLGLTALVAMPCWRAGAAMGAVIGPGSSARSGIALRIRSLSTAAAVFGITAGAMAMLVRVDSVQARPLTTAAGGFALFAACAAVPFVRATRRARHPLEDPSITLTIARAAAGALGVLIATSALVGGSALALHAGAARELSEQVGGGLSGLPLALLGALCVPNAVIAALAYLAGPGFAVGTGATVTAGGAAVGAVPAFPLLAALPADHGAHPVVLALMVAAPLGAGGVAVRLLWLGLPYRRPLALVCGSITAALMCGFAASMLAALSGGALGDRRLADIGPPIVLTGAAVAAEVALAALLVLGAFGAWTLWLRRRVPAEDAAKDSQGVEPDAGLEADGASADDGPTASGALDR